MPLFPPPFSKSELFGHEKGAFTGAAHATEGKFEQASRGTLFLDEIGNMSLPFQRKILRVVEYRRFTRVGGKEEIQVRTKIIAATNTDLKEKMRKGQFLPDLYDRLAFEEIRVPPLRDRDGEIEIPRAILPQSVHEGSPRFRRQAAIPDCDRSSPRLQLPRKRSRAQEHRRARGPIATRPTSSRRRTSAFSVTTGSRRWAETSRTK